MIRKNRKAEKQMGNGFLFEEKSCFISLTGVLISEILSYVLVGVGGGVIVLLQILEFICS